VTNTGALPRSVGTAGDLSLRAFGSSTHVVLDAFGWYSPPGETVPISPSNSDATRLFPSDDGSALFFDSGLPSGAGLHRWDETDGMSFVLEVPTGGIAAAGDGSVIALNSRASDMVPPRGDSQAIDLWTWEPASGGLQQLTHLDGIESIHHVTISGDGRFVGFVTDADVGGGSSPLGTRDLYLYDRSTSAIAQLTPGAMVATGPASLSHDGSLATFAATTDPTDTSQSRTYLWHRSTGAIDALSPGGPTFRGASISADGSTVAFQLELPGSASAIAVHDVATGRTERLTPAGLHASAAPSLSGDGRFVTYLAYASPSAVTAHQADLRLVDRHAGATTTIASGSLDQFWPAITTDGRSVFFGQGPTTDPDDPIAGASHLLRWQRP
jgi:Tol biopolymer transport system component